MRKRQVSPELRSLNHNILSFDTQTLEDRPLTELTLEDLHGVVGTSEGTTNAPCPGLANCYCLCCNCFGTPL